jgi:hypothetical protein
VISWKIKFAPSWNYRRPLSVRPHCQFLFSCATTESWRNHTWRFEFLAWKTEPTKDSETTKNEHQSEFSCKLFSKNGIRSTTAQFPHKKRTKTTEQCVVISSQMYSWDTITDGPCYFLPIGCLTSYGNTVDLWRMVWRVAVLVCWCVMCWSVENMQFHVNTHHLANTAHQLHIDSIILRISKPLMVLRTREETRVLNPSIMRPKLRKMKANFQLFGKKVCGLWRSQLPTSKWLMTASVPGSITFRRTLPLTSLQSQLQSHHS